MAVIPLIDSKTADDNLGELEHLFVVMMENRSFDQMLGYRSVVRPGGALDPDVDGIGDDGEMFGIPPVFEPVFHQPETLYEEDPPHSRDPTLATLGPADAQRGGTRFADRFRSSLQSAESADPLIAKGVLGYHDEREVPILHHLAEQFCVCDRWFSSSAGSTWANRLFLYYGRSGSVDQPLIDNPDVWRAGDRQDARSKDRGERDTKIAELDLDGRDKREARRDMRQDQREQRRIDRKDNRAEDPLLRKYFDAINTPSIFEIFEACGKEWGIYHDGAVPWKILLPNRLPGVRAVVRNLVTLDPTQQMISGRYGRIRGLDALARDIRQGDVPKLVFLDPDLHGRNRNDDHAPADVTRGQQFLKRVYDLLTADANLFKRSALVVIWDEHGGFFDHVDPRRFRTGDGSPFAHYGVRVPALVAGGRIPARSVSKLVFDHTSVMATAIRRFAPEALTSVDLPKRVRDAHHLGYLMTAPERSSFVPSPAVLRTPRTAARDNEQFGQWMSLLGMR